MASAMRTIISKSLFVPVTSPAFFTSLQVAAGIGERAGFLVSVGGRQHHIGHDRRLGQEHVLHDDKRLRERKRIDVVSVPTGFDPTTYSAFSFPAFAASTISGKVKPGSSGNRSPTPRGTCSGIGHAVIAGQHVGIKTHVRCAARIGVVGRGR